MGAGWLRNCTHYQASEKQNDAQGLNANAALMPYTYRPIVALVKTQIVRTKQHQPRNPNRGALGYSWMCLTLLIGVCLMGSCQTRPDLVRVIDSKIIDSLLAAAPQTLIDTDAQEPETWYPDRAVAQATESLALGSSFSFTIAQDSLFIADFTISNLYTAGLDGPLQRRFGLMGEGPLEYDFPSGIQYNGTYFFVPQAVSSIKVLSDELTYVATIPLSDALLLPPNPLAVSTSHLYSGCSVGNPFRVCPRNSEPPFEELAPFLPSMGTSEPDFDSITFLAASPDGRYVVAAFGSLPYLFVFNGAHEHIRTIRFYGSEIREYVNNHEVKRPGIPGIGLRALWRGIDFLGADVIALIRPSRVYLIRILDESRFEHMATLQFSLAPAAIDGDENVELAAPDELMLHEDFMYVNYFDAPHILRYRSRL